MVHIPPDPHILQSFHNSNLSWWKALAELVDNSLDAGAARVVIDVSNRVLTVTDDGEGCEDITSVFTLGNHKRRKATKRSLGRYGIGAKDAWLSCADTMEVTTYRNNLKTFMRVNSTEWMQNDWNVPDPLVEESTNPSGTVIRLPLRNGKNTPTEEAFKALAFAFTPAISRGIQIVKSLNRRHKPLIPVQMPLRSDVVQCDFDVDGKNVKIDIGILPDGVTIERGPFWLIYGHRIIEATSIGAGQYSVRRIAGTIIIGDGWALAKNKDDLSESHERLHDAIFMRIEHVLKKADQLAETIEAFALRNELQDMLNNAMNDANGKREKRDKGNSIGSSPPKRTGRKRRNAAKTQDGEGSVLATSKTGRKGGYILDWCEMDSEHLGNFDRSGMRVSLNLNNGLVNFAKTEMNRAALTACAVALIADYCCRSDERGNSLMRFAFDDFSQAMGVLVKDYREGKQDVKTTL